MADYRSNIKDEVEVTPYRKIQNGSITGDMVKDRTITKNKLAEGVIPPINNKHNYSTEEQVVGKWIDGKPLYEKTFYFNNVLLTSDNATSELTHGLANIDFAMIKNSYYRYTALDNYWHDTSIIRASYGGPANTYRTSFVCGDRAFFGFLLDTQFDAFDTRSYIVTIQYTKTTDVPNA